MATLDAIPAARWRSLAPWLVAFAAFGIPLWIVRDAWSGGKALAYALGAYFPLTDAAIWWTCSAQLAGLGHIIGPFGWVAFDSSGYCTNRPSHAGLLATLQVLAGLNPENLQLLLALMVGTGAAYFCHQAGRTFGWLAAAMTCMLVLAYASEHALSMFTSEPTGLFLGLLGLGSVLRFSRTQAWPDALLGISFLSIGLFSRAGAMLAFPLLLFWLFVQSREFVGRRRYLFLLAGTCALGAGFLLQKAQLLLIGDPSSGYFSNYSALLYALATGSRDWRETLLLYGVETPYPVETMNMILPLAIPKVLEQPATFFHALLVGEQEYLGSLFAVPLLEPAGPLLAGLLTLGLVGIALGARRPAFQVLLLVATAEALSAPLVIHADGQRVLATTFPVRCLLVGIGVAVLCRILVAALRGQTVVVARLLGDSPKASSVEPSSLRYNVLPLAGFILAVLFTATPVARPFHLEPISANGVICPDGYPPVILVANRASAALFIDRKSVAPGSPGTISGKALESETRDAWFRDDFAKLPDKTLLLRGIDRHPANFGREISIVQHNADSAPKTDDVLRLCIPHLAYPPYREFLTLAVHRFFFASPVTRQPN